PVGAQGMRFHRKNPRDRPVARVPARCPPPEAHVTVGTAIAGEARRFRFIRCIGVGGFGEVYLAEMMSAGGVRSNVAVKLLRPGVDPRSSPIERLRDEGRLLGMLDHPVIL